jgi:RNA 3'-terminal phosphate cyclase (ATP)
MIHIDGSQGEGGGQMLRSSLALSMATGRPFHMTRIRAGRAKPGLMRQHLMCVTAAAQICGGEAMGATLGSQEIAFKPGKVRGGDYTFAIGSAGSTMMVLQAILPALLRAEGATRVAVEGGTHNTMAPPFEFFERCLVPVLRDAGVVVRPTLERHGFYPAGGGRVVVEVEPAREAKAVERLERGTVRSVRAICIVSQLSRAIAERELIVLREKLGLEEGQAEVVSVPRPVGPGNMAMVEIESDHAVEVVSACGELGKPAEKVAEEVASEAREYLESGTPVGQHLADQLMVPLALLAGGKFRTRALTEHSRTNIQIVRLFGGCVEAQADGIVEVHRLG